MSTDQASLSRKDYERMAEELEAMSKLIRGHPEMNHHFAERLALIARQMREDAQRTTAKSKE